MVARLRIVHVDAVEQHLHLFERGAADGQVALHAVVLALVDHHRGQPVEQFARRAAGQAPQALVIEQADRARQTAQDHWHARTHHLGAGQHPERIALDDDEFGSRTVGRGGGWGGGFGAEGRHDRAGKQRGHAGDGLEHGRVSSPRNGEREFPAMRWKLDNRRPIASRRSLVSVCGIQEAGRSPVNPSWAGVSRAIHGWPAAAPRSPPAPWQWATPASWTDRWPVRRCCQPRRVLPGAA